jgi:2,4-dienoyl-CoA reductase-like NADH-dependent reductase (Old Yellow Enzyme family)
MGAVPAIQLGHCGRNAGSHGAMEDWRALDERDARAGMPPWRGLAPSPLPARRSFPVPIEMDHDDIRTVLAAFRDAAHRATDAGYDICEIHGAHGYLIHQFLSPVSNRRTDAYGGSREARMRFALEVAETVRAAWPQDKPLFFRVSAVDGKGGLWGLDDTVALARELRLREVDVVDCSSGGIAGDSGMVQVPRVPGYQVPYASRVRRETGIMTMAVGLITEPCQAEAVLAEGHADLVAMARELMIHADWPLRAAKVLDGGEYDLMAPSIAHRLRRRDEQAVAYPQGSAVEIPIMADRREPYSWQ